VRSVVAGDPSPDGKGILAIQRGIEVGHVFSGLPYPQIMNLRYTDESGKSQLMLMGCYGIGVTRLLGAAIEQNYDDKGIVWPDAIAPFTVALTPVGYGKSEQVRQVADQLCAQLQSSGVDVLLDDRDERPGVMFAEMELIGIPHRITIGERSLKEGNVEYVSRRSLQTTPVPIAEAFTFVRAQLDIPNAIS
jgi:prolyl-tRNA synthetase